MDLIVPARKKRIIPFIVIGIFLYIIARYFVIFMQPCQGCIEETANSNAKRVFIDASTYITKAEASGNKLGDGVYTGCIVIDDKYDLDDYNCGPEVKNPDAYDGTAETFDLFMKSVIGSVFKEAGFKEAGYYYVMVRDGLPEQAYWSDYKSLLDYEQKLTDDLNCGTASENIFIGGDPVGGYPREICCYSEETPPYSKEFERLNSRYRLKNGLRDFYIYSIEPLLYTLPVVFVIYLAYLLFYHLLNMILPKNRENKWAVIGLMTEYAKKCRVPVADGNICGVLYARKDDFVNKVLFDGSAVDIENYLNNYTVSGKAKAYYKLKFEGGIVTECAFGYSKWIHKTKKEESDNEA